AVRDETARILDRFAQARRVFDGLQTKLRETAADIRETLHRLGNFMAEAIPRTTLSNSVPALPELQRGLRLTSAVGEDRTLRDLIAWLELFDYQTPSHKVHFQTRKPNSKEVLPLLLESVTKCGDAGKSGLFIQFLLPEI